MAERSVVITGGLHGIGAEIVDRFAQENSNIAIIANSKSADMDRISELFSQYRKMGSEVRILPTDIMDESDVQASVDKAAAANGGVIDVCVNAASILQAITPAETSPDKLDLFYKINAKSTFIMSRACLPYLKKSHNAHILNIAPPINLDPKVMGYRIAYTTTQYLRSMLTISIANSEMWKGIACNSLWPVSPFYDGGNLGIYQSHIDTMNNLKSVKLFSEAAYGIVTQPADRFSGEFFYDEEVLEMLGVSLDQFVKNSQNQERSSQENNYTERSSEQEINYNRETETENVAYEESFVD